MVQLFILVFLLTFHLLAGAQKVPLKIVNEKLRHGQVQRLKMLDLKNIKFLLIMTQLPFILTKNLIQIHHPFTLHYLEALRKRYTPTIRTQTVLIGLIL